MTECSDTPDTPEALIAYTARVSSPHQDNPDYEKLIAYCLANGHWSVFEMVDATIEIETSRAIAQQILRHRSFSFQEFSQRYAKVQAFEHYEARRQDDKNRQNSIDDLPEKTKEWFRQVQVSQQENAMTFYKIAIQNGIAKEQARFLLPIGVQTKLYMKGSLRSWIHYLQVRTDASTQKEHRDIANACKSILANEFPVIAKVLGWVS